MSFSLYVWKYAYHRWKARSQAILSVVKNLGADFFCLQVSFYVLCYIFLLFLKGEKNSFFAIYITCCFEQYKILSRKLMSMTAFTKEIWRAMDILVRIFREVGKSVTDVEFFINTKCRLKIDSFSQFNVHNLHTY